MEKQTVLSVRMRQAAKLADKPLYKLALEAGISPNAAYRSFRGIEGVHRGDERYLLLGVLLGVPPDEVFEEQSYGIGLGVDR